MSKRSLTQSLNPHQSVEGVKKRVKRVPSTTRYKLVISKPISATHGLKEEGVFFTKTKAENVEQWNVLFSYDAERKMSNVLICLCL